MAQVSSLWDGCGARGTRTWSAGSVGPSELADAGPCGHGRALWDGMRRGGVGAMVANAHDGQRSLGVSGRVVRTRTRGMQRP